MVEVKWVLEKGAIVMKRWIDLEDGNRAQLSESAQNGHRPRSPLGKPIKVNPGIGNIGAT